VSRISAERLPSSAMPMIGRVDVPSARSWAPPKRPWFDSTRPMPASSGQLSRQPGSVRATCLAARW
jgi:hypothetical protein